MRRLDARRALRALALVGSFVSTLLAGSTATAQSLDDLQLRKASSATRLGFGFVGLIEGASGLNADRPEGYVSLFASPQLKVGPALRFKLNLSANAGLLARQENQGWFLDDWSLEVAHNRLAVLLRDHVTLSARARYYLPLSKASRDSGSYGQLRGYGKALATAGRWFFSSELSVFKGLHEYTTWAPDSTAGSEAWFQEAGRDFAVDNNSSYGFGEVLTAGATVLPGLDLSLTWGLYQDRRYQPDAGHGDEWGSSYLQRARATAWDHRFRFVLDATYCLGGIRRLPWAALKRTFVSLGYSIYAPQLQNEGHDRSLNPFNAKYALVYTDVSFIY